MDQSDERPGKIVHLAREVLHIAEAQHNQPESIDERLLRSIRTLQVAAEGLEHYVMRKRHQVRYPMKKHRRSQDLERYLGNKDKL